MELTQAKIDTWCPYIRAFTQMQKCLAGHDYHGAYLYRREMTAFLEASPDYWRATAIRAKQRGETGVGKSYYKQGTIPEDRKAHTSIRRRKK